MNHPTDELTDFERRVVAEAARRLPEQLVAAYLEMLVGKGYVKKDSSGRYKVSDKNFLDLLMEAADDVNKKVAPIKNWKDPRPVLAWHMARIVLGYDVDTPHDRMNAEEMGRLMSVINVFLDTHFSNPRLLNLALRI
jgi:hypothetical protein